MDNAFDELAALLIIISGLGALAFPGYSAHAGWVAILILWIHLNGSYTNWPSLQGIRR